MVGTAANALLLLLPMGSFFVAHGGWTEWSDNLLVELVLDAALVTTLFASAVGAVLAVSVALLNTDGTPADDRIRFALFVKAMIAQAAAALIGPSST